MSKSKGQMVALVDFARLPEGTKEPDFWSDHHQSDEPESKGGGRTGATEFKSDASHLATLHTENMVDGKTIDVVNKIDSAGYTDLTEILKLPKDFRKARRLERLGIICNALLTKSGILKNSSLLEEFIKKTKPSIVSFYNNMMDYVRLNDIQDEAIKEIAKENPDWDKIERARKAMPSKRAASKIQASGEKTPARSRIRAIEKNESVFDNIKSGISKKATEQMKERLKEDNPKLNLNNTFDVYKALMMNTGARRAGTENVKKLTSKIVGKSLQDTKEIISKKIKGEDIDEGALDKISSNLNRKMIEKISKNMEKLLDARYSNIDKTSVIQVHDAVSKMKEFKNINKQTLYKAISNITGNSTRTVINKLMEETDIDEGALEDYEELQKLKKKGDKRTEEEEERYKELVDQPISQLRSRRAASAEKAKSSGDLVPKGAVVLQSNPRLQRYLWTQMNKAGLKYPFVIKKYATFLQVAVNPELPSAVKDYVDLGAVATDVMTEVRKKFENKYNSWAFKIIEKERGGHKGITNIPALGTLGLMKKADREELKYLESLEDRIKKLKTLGSRKLDEKDKEKLKKARQMLKRKTATDVDKEYYAKLEKILAPTMEKMMPEKAERLKELKNKKKESAKKRKEIMEEIIEEFQRQFKKKFKAQEDVPVIGKTNVKLTGGRKEFEFEEENATIKRMRQIAEG